MPISSPENFLRELEKKLFIRKFTFFQNSVSAKSEKCEFFDRKVFANTPRNFSRANLYGHDQGMKNVQLL